MKSILFQIPMRAVSLNNSNATSYIKGRLIRHKTKQAKSFDKEFDQLLLGAKDSLQELKKAFNEKNNALYVDAFYYFNEKEFFTVEKRISSRVPDLDNCLKASLDRIFKTCGVDDKNVVSINAQKIPTNGEAKMFFRISIGSFPSLHLISSDSLSDLSPL
jgi:Holliday junction resolvase RusA-like endonuclease